MTGWISGAAVTAFGRDPRHDAVGWQEEAAYAALADAGLDVAAVDGMLVGYATTLGHLMPADLLAQRLGVRPAVAFGVSSGGATGLTMVATASQLVASGAAERVLVVAGEDRRSGQSTQTSTEALAQVGHRELEVPLGATVPAYYALLASAYLHRHGLLPEKGLAPLAVQMRAHAGAHEGAHLRTPITIDDVLQSRRVADPLRLLDCCPVSDGGAAVVVTRTPAGPRAVRLAGTGQAHLHQHLCELDLDDTGARRSAAAALDEAGRTLAEVDLLGVYDSFTVTLAMLLEEIGVSAPGQAGADASAGRFDRTGPRPLNTHGGLLSYGHCGVAGGMAHLVEAVTQLRGEGGVRQVPGGPRLGLVHADGGILSAHASLVLEGAGA
ncbi:thiolase family protein [Nocardioides sp. KR10-350]|uniref:thiolase family protein n=1 Tax=Nocardioides cheoyonin TaxID=3156615 RepID=UPI0032B47CCA